MSDLVSPDEIERIVGAKRHATMHIGRAVSSDETVYVLHSQCGTREGRRKIDIGAGRYVFACAVH